MNMGYRILFVLMLSLTLPALAEEKSVPAKKAAAGELAPAEIRQVERMTTLYEELAQQVAETQMRLRVLQEMQQKLVADFDSFQLAAVTARGFKAGEAAVDLQARKVTPLPSKTDTPSTPNK